MHKNFKIKSKINVTPPKKVHYFVILLNIALILILVSGIFQIIMDGFKIGTLAYMGLAVAIVSGFKNRSENKEHYEFSVADTYFTPDSIVIRYGQIKQYKGKRVSTTHITMNRRIRLFNNALNVVEKVVCL